MNEKQLKNLVIYQADNGAIELPIDANHETIWATQKQIAEVFAVTPQNITQHLKAIYSEGEMEESATCKEFLQVQNEGGRAIRRKTKQYNLDAIIAVGYRIGSGKGTAFRKWATKTLRSYITDGFAINPARIEHNRTQFTKALQDLQLLAATTDQVGSTEAVDLTIAFAKTWFSLNAFDKDTLPVSGTIKQHVDVGAQELQAELAKLKQQLVHSHEATDIFATERTKGGLDSLFHNVFQSFDGEDVYPTLEEKAAHLLYFTVKNHVFIDGNKRSGAYAFVWFLQKVGLLNMHEISPQALTAITLLVAESNPKDKDKMVGLVLLLLGVTSQKAA
ncbi:Fic/DOC family protein [Candidatus Saccharibacteria bacterium]|nr:Fic/DOC family protein [Candidatus Saccharibacteria bacterium]